MLEAPDLFVWALLRGRWPKHAGQDGVLWSGEPSLR